jgi:hypothetical protein
MADVCDPLLKSIWFAVAAQPYGGGETYRGEYET